MAGGRRTMKGRFVPRNPQKYSGDPSKIFGRSSWEFRLFAWLDSTPSILSWSSEEISIPYISPADGRIHKYFPDAFVVYRDKSGNTQQEIVEIKPHSEVVLRKNASDAEKVTWAINQAKWAAAADFCKRKGYTFRVLTEHTLFKTAASKKAGRPVKTDPSKMGPRTAPAVTTMGTVGTRGTS